MSFRTGPISSPTAGSSSTPRIASVRGWSPTAWLTGGSDVRRTVVPLLTLRLATCHVHGPADEPRRPHHQDRDGFGQSAEEVERRCRSDHGHAKATHLVSIAPRAERASGAFILVHDGQLHGLDAVPSSGHLARRPVTPRLGFTLHAV